MGCSGSKSALNLPPATVTENPVDFAQNQPVQQTNRHQQQQQQHQQQQISNGIVPAEEHVTTNQLDSESQNPVIPLANITSHNQSTSPTYSPNASPIVTAIAADSAVLTTTTSRQQNGHSNQDQIRQESIPSVFATIDENGDEEKQIDSLSPIILPNDPQFTCSINGRNGYSLGYIYEYGTTRDDILGEGSFGKVYRGKHKYPHLDTPISRDATDEYDDAIDRPESADQLSKDKKLFMFGSRGSDTHSSANGTAATTSSSGRSDVTVTASLSSEATKQAGVEYVAPSRISLQRARRQQINDEFKQPLAIKTTKPTGLDTRGGRTIHTYSNVEKYCSEVQMLLRLRGKNATDSCCLFLFEYFFVPITNEIHLVTELLGQELDQWRQSHTSFMEKDAMAAAKSVLKAIDYMHSKSVVHRDVKLQNVLFQHNSSDPRKIKIVDFGLSVVLQGNQTTRDFCGSLGYISPEIYERKSYRFEVDMFAFGVLLFRLLSGERPFPSNNQDVLQRHTVELRYNVHGRDWRTVSDSAKDLIRRLLINRQERWTAEQCLKHEWFSSSGESILRPDLSIIGDRSDGESRSRAFVKSAAPTEPPATIEDHNDCIWVDGALQFALVAMQSMEVYHGVVVDATVGNTDSEGMICIKERIPPDAEPLPVYIGRRGTYTEMDCRFLCRQLAECISCMHANGLAHRNLHMENALSDRWGKVSVKGFEFSQPIVEGKPLTGHFGYLYSWFAFKAPEIDTAFFHDQSVDLWSLGAIIYMLLTGLPPFRGTGAELVEAKRDGRVIFDVVQPSDAAQDLVRSLLQVQPEQRLTISEVLQQEWMTADDSFLENFDLSLSLSMMQVWNA